MHAIVHNKARVLASGWRYPTRYLLRVFVVNSFMNDRIVGVKGIYFVYKTDIVCHLMNEVIVNTRDYCYSIDI